MAGKLKKSSSKVKHGGSKKAKRSREVPPNPLDILFNNPGYSHIAQKTFLCLDHQSWLSSRLVCHSWKAHMDPLNFWIKKCDQFGCFKSQGEKHSHASVAKILEKGSEQEEEFRKLLMNQLAEKCWKNRANIRLRKLYTLISQKFNS